MGARAVGLIVALVFLAGCVTTKEVVKEVKVPVAVPLPQVEVKKPELPRVKFVSPADDDAVVCLTEEELVNLLTLVSRMWNYQKELERALEVYKNYGKEVLDEKKEKK
uniref:Uncharacterized protein n=1 Tax=candidate division CPR3 bacterium TaxID=2268181 RepID=A0A7V3JAK5_UNCC3